MKDLILITAYTPTLEHEKLLERAILSVKKVGFDILLVSHSHTPLNIQQMCQYYFYDHINDVTDDIDFRYFEFFKSNDFQIQSKYFTKNFYGFAIYRMFSIASKIAQTFGYERLYHMEYDCELIENSLLFQHREILQSHDAVFYTYGGGIGDFLIACLKSFKVESLPETFVHYNKEYITDVMINTPCKPLENYTKKIFQDSNVKYLDSRDIFESGKFVQNNLTTRKKHFTIFYNFDTEMMNFFFRNMWDYNQKVMIITNGELITTIDSPSGHFHVRPLCPMSDFRSVMIFVDNSLVYEFKIENQQELENFKENSFGGTYEKNN